MIDVIWKFPFDVKDEFSIDVPIGSIFLKVDTQRGSPVIWFQVHNASTDVKYETRKFKVIGTGHTFQSSWIE